MVPFIADETNILKHFIVSSLPAVDDHLTLVQMICESCKPLFRILQYVF